MHLADDWLTDDERIVKQRELQRREEIRTRMQPTSTAPTHLPTPTIAPPDAEIPAFDAPTPTQPSVPPLIAAAPLPTMPTMSDSISRPTVILDASSSSSGPALRRSQRSTKGTYNRTKFIDEVFLTPLDRVKEADAYTRQLAYVASLYTCLDTGLEDIIDPRVYAAKNRKDDPDSPTFNQANNGPNANEYIQAMQLEISNERPT